MESLQHNSKSDSTERVLVSEVQLNQITALESDSFDTADAFHQLISRQKYTQYHPERSESYINELTDHN
jgi:hypothetical protein